MDWVDDDLHGTKDLREGHNTVAYVRFYENKFRLIVRGTDTYVPIFLEYETQEEAMEAAVGFVKLLKEN